MNKAPPLDMDTESRGSLDTTISHSSHATDLYTVSHNDYDVPRDALQQLHGQTASGYEMWQLPETVKARDKANSRRYENWEPATGEATTNNNNNKSNPNQRRVSCAFKVVAVILLLLLLLVIAVAEVLKAVQWPRPT